MIYNPALKSVDFFEQKFLLASWRAFQIKLAWLRERALELFLRARELHVESERERELARSLEKKFANILNNVCSFFSILLYNKILELKKLIYLFSDQEINNECLVVCDGEFFECTKNCENSECSRKCFEELDGTFKKMWIRINNYFSLWKFVPVRRRLSNWLRWLSRTSALRWRMRKRAIEQ